MDRSVEQWTGFLFLRKMACAGGLLYVNMDLSAVTMILPIDFIDSKMGGLWHRHMAYTMDAWSS